QPKEIFYPTGPFCSAATTYPPLIFTTQERLVVEMQSEFCDVTDNNGIAGFPGTFKQWDERTGRPIDRASTLGFRVVSGQQSGYNNVSIAPEYRDPQSCKNTFYSSGKNNNMLSQSIYYQWQQSYNVASKTIIPYYEKYYKGSFAAGPGFKIEETPFSIDPAT